MEKNPFHFLMMVFAALIWYFIGKFTLIES